MGFLDKARAAATDLTAKAESALSSSGINVPGGSGGGDTEKLFRDLGVLTYLESSGRGADPQERLRVETALRELDARGVIRSFALHTATPPAPPAPGVAAAAAGWVEHSDVAPPGAAATAPPTVPGPPVAAPPPPSWMTRDESSDS